MTDRDELDRWFGAEPATRRWLPAPTDPPAFPDGPDRYTVQVVYADGNPEVVERHDTLRSALDAADFRWKKENERGFRCFVGVQDSENPERGWLHEEDDA